MWGPSGCHLCQRGLGMWGPHGQPRSTPLCTYGARLAHMGPSRHLHRSDLAGPIWALWFKWAAGIWDPCGQPHIYPMWASGIWDPCGQPHIYPMWASGIWTHVGCPGGSHLGSWVAYGARLAHVGPSRHLHCGTHLGPMLVKVVLTYFWYLWTLELVVTYCYIKCIYTRPFANLPSALLKLPSKLQFEIKVSNALINLQKV